VKNFQGPDTRLVELGDRALLPGFIDAHGHFSSMARAADLVDLSSPPVGVVEEIDDIVRLLRLSIENERIPADNRLTGLAMTTLYLRRVVTQLEMTLIELQLNIRSLSVMYQDIFWQQTHWRFRARVLQRPPLTPRAELCDEILMAR